MTEITTTFPLRACILPTIQQRT